MTNETIAALERAAEFLVNGGTRCQQDAALMRAHIKTLRAGGERAQIVALKLALKEARDVFQHYGDLHAAKPDPVKAQRNYDLAERMQAAINKRHRSRRASRG